jgi:hypothetical protein
MTIGQLRNLLAEYPDTENITIYGYERHDFAVEEVTRKKNGVVTKSIYLNVDYAQPHNNFRN